MRRIARTPVFLLALSLAACTTAAGARRAELRRGLDQARIARSPAEIWTEVQRFLHERGYPLVGDDRIAVGLQPQGSIGKLFSPGFQTRVRDDGGRILETDADERQARVRVEALAAAGGGTRLRVAVLKRSESNPTDYLEWKDEELELALLQRLDPVAAAGVLGKGAPAAAATATAAPGAPAPAAPAVTDGWTPVRHLVGAWEGTLPGGAQVRWRFDFAGAGSFVEMRGTPLLFAGPVAAGGGEEMGRLSRSPSGDRLAWYQFTFGGRVDRYVSEPSPSGALVFVAAAPESLPDGRARLTLAREGDAGLRATLELAAPGQDFATFGEVRLKRAQ